MKLYDFAFSPNSRKVRAVAYELGIPLDHHPVDLLKGAQHSPAFLALNPNGRVPVLVDGDFVLWESIAIFEVSGSQATAARSCPRAPPSRRTSIDGFRGSSRTSGRRSPRWRSSAW